MTEKYILKIPNKRRIIELKHEFSECGIWKLLDKNEEAVLFSSITNKNAYVDEKGVLFLEKIDAKPLSSFLEKEELFLSYFTKSMELLLVLNTEKNFVHGDFHMDNILIDDGTIFFIDYDYTYTQEYALFAPYNDVVHLLYVFKKYYPQAFQKYAMKLRIIVEKRYERNKLVESMKKMECFFKIGYNELW